MIMTQYEMGCGQFYKRNATIHGNELGHGLASTV